MTDDRRLRDKLAKLAADETGQGERRLPGADMTRAMLEEIDETILPRRLAFRAKDGTTLTMDIANRRLLGIVEAPEALLPAGERDRLLAPLEAEDDAALAAVADMLKRFGAAQETLGVSATALDRPTGAGMVGRSAAAVARAVGLDLYDRPASPVTPDPAQGFAAGLARLALAVVAISDGEPAPATGSDAEAVDRLSRLDAAGIAALEGELAGGAESAPFLLLSGAGEALFLGRRSDGRAVAALLSHDRAGAAVALWRETGGA